MTEPTTPKLTKTSIALDIFNSVQGEEAPRKAFITAVQDASNFPEDLEPMTAKGASTYWQNFKREAAGGKRYVHSKRAAKNAEAVAPISKDGE